MPLYALLGDVGSSCRGWSFFKREGDGDGEDSQPTSQLLPFQNIDLSASGITVNNARDGITKFKFVHPHPMGQDMGYFNLTKILFVILMLVNAFVEVRQQRLSLGHCDILS